MRKLNWLLVAAPFAVSSGVAHAEVTANVGMVSDYIFRGYYQEDASPFGGLDYAADSGFYIGTWGADVGDGLEVDVYFGYGGGNDDFNWSVGYTGYRYTEDTYDDDYDELNFSIGSGGFGLEVALGQYGNFGPEVDYTYAAISYELMDGTSFKLAQTDFDGVGGSSGSDGIWFELGHAWEVAEDTEISVTFLYSPDGDDPNSTIFLSPDNPLSKHALVLGITKNMTIGD